MRWSVVGAAVASVVVAACGGGSDSGGGGGNGTCSPSTQASMTISSTGVTPKAVCVEPNGTVVFANTDSAAHQVVGDGACTQLNVSVPAGASQSAAVGAVERTCTFHDGGAPTNTAFQGTVAVTSAPASGPGY